ncbi:hypothetical protein NST11_03380 [Caldifermentibacillus hisashii]|uniref:hypothetical protein n=1 Tax=Caldifermentibacillus hisashii TaxID=996558 RepID=UPI0031B7B20D
MVTRKGFVVKKWGFPAQNDDEKESRRQKIEFSTPKRRREKGSSPKKGVSRLKMTTRLGLVAKKWGFSAQNGDENRSRRQKSDFPALKLRQKCSRQPKIKFPPHPSTRRALVF